jgi:hypothetical protein
MKKNDFVKEFPLANEHFKLNFTDDPCNEGILIQETGPIKNGP